MKNKKQGKATTPEEFVRLWQTCRTVADVAQRVGSDIPALTRLAKSLNGGAK